MWIYILKTGQLVRDGKVVGTGYAGGNCGKNPEGRNNSAMQQVHNIGPIPCGEWRIAGLPHDHPKLGKFVLNLEPVEGTQTFGRLGFRMHGDKIGAPGTASEGCIVQNRLVRNQVWESGDKRIYVIADWPLPALDQTQESST